MDIRLPDGTIIRGIPDGTSKADITAKLAAKGYDVSKLGGAPAAQVPNYVLPEADPVKIYEKDPNTGQTTSRLQQPSGTRPRMSAEQKQANINRGRELAAPDRTWRDDTLIGNVMGIPDAAIGVLGSMGTGIVAPPAGFIQSMFNGKDPETNANAIAERIAPRPATGTGAQILRGIGAVAAPLAALPSTTLLQGGQAVGSGVTGLRGMAGPGAAAMGAQDAALVAGAPKMNAGTLADLVRAPKPAAMAGVGAAETADATLRAQRFAAMRAPMKPTKGILTRSIDDVQFEREAAKRPEGKALDARYAQLNEGMSRHMDALIDETGSTAVSRRATGKSVTAAIEAKKAAKKSEVDKAYQAARESGDMAEQIDVQPILDFVGKNRSAARNAGILHSIEDEANRLAGDTGKISLNDMEELRKMVNNLSEPGKPNGHYGGQAIKLIDKISEGKGGPQYQQARRLNENMMKEFSDRDVIDKVLRTKRGTSDRAVAYEDVAKHIISNGSLDDMKHAFRVLEAHPVGTAPEIVAAGQQAARDLRGAAMADIKKRLFSNAGANSAGKTVGSEAKMKAIISELDDEGKLEYLYGKKGAQEIRDTLDVATDIYTTPAGTVNSSNTASALERVLSRAEGMVGGTPVVGHALRYGAKKLESRNMTKKVNAALEPTPPPKPRTLRDMAGDQ